MFVFSVPRCAVWGPKQLQDLPKDTQRISTKNQGDSIKEEEGFDVRPTVFDPGVCLAVQVIRCKFCNLYKLQLILF